MTQDKFDTTALDMATNTCFIVLARAILNDNHKASLMMPWQNNRGGY